MVDYSSDIKACVAALAAGETILYPTDTIWGIGCDATNESAVEEVFKLKKRPKEKSLIVLISDARDILKYVAAPPPHIIDIVTSFDRPTTVVFDGAINLAESAINDDGSVALRVPQDEFCRALIKRFGKPIISTSANISGQASAPFFAAIHPTIKGGVGYCVKFRQDDETLRQPSRIVRIDSSGVMSLLRD
jgi:L-threonylcarbamoyladenylate synthase